MKKKPEIKDTMGEIKANLLIRKLFRFLITPSLLLTWLRFVQ